ncbi:MAG: hypothetical protein OXH34_01795 [Bacteroidetes bacterium]|nr:hypothetical protein [Bacteroidota bacterium]
MGAFPLLLTEELVQDSLGKIPATSERNTSAFNRAISDMTGVTERFLNRELAVRKTTQILPITRWKHVHTFNYAEGFLTHFPMVQILTVTDGEGNDVSSDYSLHDVTDRQERLIRGPVSFRWVRVTGFTGYRRVDQDLTALQAIDGLSDLTELPPVLPDEIRSALTEITLNRLILASKGQLGTNQQISGIGQQEVRISAPDKMFVNDRLRDLVDYRRVF